MIKVLGLGAPLSRLIALSPSHVLLGPLQATAWPLPWFSLSGSHSDYCTSVPLLSCFSNQTLKPSQTVSRAVPGTGQAASCLSLVHTIPSARNALPGLVPGLSIAQRLRRSGKPPLLRASLASCRHLILFFFFSGHTMWHGLRDLSSPTRNGTSAPCSGSAES